MRRTQADWDAFFYRFALQVGEQSKDRRKVGAVLVTADRRALSFGYNGFPPDVPDTLENLANAELRAARMVHAEDNALRQAPVGLRWETAYVTRFPCQHCADKLIMAPVARIVAPLPDFKHPRWGASWQRAYNDLHFYSVEVLEAPCD